MSSILLTSSRKYPGIPTVGGDVLSHTKALEALRDAVQIHERRSNDVLSSFVRVKELIDLGLLRVVGKNRVELTFDPALVGTGGSGGATALADLTDVDLAGLTDRDLLVYDAGYGLWLPEPPATGEGTPAYPGTVPDLQLWWESDLETATSGVSISRLRDRTPGKETNLQAVNGNGPLGSASTLNGLPVVNFNASSNARMSFPNIFLARATVFLVINPTAFGGFQTYLGGATNGGLQLVTDASGNLQLYKSGGSVIGTSSIALSTATWYQINATYEDAGGAYAFRIARTARGSGNNIQTINNPNNQFCHIQTVQDVNALVAAFIVYNRVLSGTEITDVEDYLFDKWGV